ncbi:MAG: response regulator [Archangium sp.]|nr:response regulator [Archangium sp.]
MNAPQVLLAEDDAELRRFLCDVLRKKGYAVTEAASGDDLLERLWERSHAPAPFDLIVSDVRMPGLTGLEVLDGLRDDFEPSIGDTPVIFITAFGDAEVHEEARDMRAIVFDKPFDVDELCDYAAELLRRAAVSGGLH